MSPLSPAESTAGISRRALDTIKGANGNTPRVVTALIGGFRETVIIDTPMRKLSILENGDGELILRDAEFVGNRCSVALIHLEPEQAHSLSCALDTIEVANSGPPKAPKRGRA